MPRDGAIIFSDLIGKLECAARGWLKILGRRKPKPIVC
jgi:hypothetical protein